MTKTTALLLALIGCTTEGTPPEDAAIEIDANGVLPIAWSEWGNACEASVIVASPCRSSVDEGGWCIIDEPRKETTPGLWAGTCQPPCQTASYLCPEDAWCAPKQPQGLWVCEHR